MNMDSSELQTAGEAIKNIAPPGDVISSMQKWLEQLVQITHINPIVLVLLAITTWLVKEYLIPPFTKFLPSFLEWPAAILVVITIYSIVLIPLYGFVLGMLCNIAGVCT